MKKTMKLFGAIMSAIILAACSQTELKEAPAPSDGGNGANELVAGIAEVQGKTAISGEEAGVYKIRWNADDAISVNGVTVSNPVLSADNLTATFDGTGLEAPYRALYPAALVDAGSFERYTVNGTDTTGYKSSNGNWYDWLTITFPETQHYTAGTFDPTVAMLAVGSESNSLAMTHICSYIKLTVTGSAANIRRVTLTHGDFKSGITGKFAVVFKENGLVSTTVVTGQVNDNLVMDCGNEGVASGTPIYIAVPERNFTGGLIITAEDVNGKLSSIKSEPFSFYDHPGIVIPVTLPFSATPAEKGQIRSANDWELFAADMNANRNLDRWIVGGKVEIVADITASTNLSRVTSEWTYILDGKGHSITQQAARGPLFMDINGGTVKDLTMKGSMKAADVYDTSNPGFSTIARTVKGNGIISGIVNEVNFSTSTTGKHYSFGPICRQILSGSILNCTNKGNVNLSIVNPSNDANIYGTGIVSIVGTLTSSPNELEGMVTISGCRNEGTISLAYTSWSTAKPVHYSAVGGIVAWVTAGNTEKYLKIENCSNIGDLSNLRPISPSIKASSAYVGGIIGVAYLPGSSSYNVASEATWPSGRTLACAYGDKQNQLSKTDTTPQSYIDGVYFEMKDCTNSGNLALAAPGSADSKIIRLKQYAGGLCGVAIGMLDHHAKISGTGIATCCNTGTVNGGSENTRSSYQSVNGGLIGLAGHIDLDGVYAGTESSAVKVGKDYKTYANGGMIGLLMSKCNANGCYVNADIIEANTTSSMKFAGALVGAIKANGLNRTDSNYYKGCKFTNCKVKGSIYIGTELTGGTITTLSSSNATGNLLCANDEVTDVSGDYDFTGTGYWE